MADILKRKCNHCKETMMIERGNTSNVIYFDEKYYHYDCFIEVATKKASSKRGKPAQWQEALDNLWILENDTIRALEYSWTKDDLNEWLLEHYDVVTVPGRFWQIVAELEQGKYKGKKCKSVKIDIILGAWRWGQQKLNKINMENKKGHKGPIDDNARIMYDLSIIINKIPNYLSHVAKTKALEATTQQMINKTKINYNNLENKASDNKLDDISDMLDEIF